MVTAGTVKAYRAQSVIYLNPQLYTTVAGMEYPPHYLAPQTQDLSKCVRPGSTILHRSSGFVSSVPVRQRSTGRAAASSVSHWAPSPTKRSYHHVNHLHTVRRRLSSSPLASSLRRFESSMLSISRNLLGRCQRRFVKTGNVMNTLPVTGESLLCDGHGRHGTEFEINRQRDCDFGSWRLGKTLRRSDLICGDSGLRVNRNGRGRAAGAVTEGFFDFICEPVSRRF